MPRQNPRWSSTFLFVVVLVVLLVAAGCGRSAQTPESSTPGTVDQTAQADSPLSPPTDTTVALAAPYSSRYFIFQPPVNWRVEEGFAGRNITLRTLQDEALYGKIEMAFASYDMAPGDNLVEWDRRMAQLRDESITADGIQVEVISHTTETLAGSETPRQTLHKRTTSTTGFVSESIWITHGSIALGAAIYVDDPATSAALAAVMQTVTFYPDTPTSVRGFGGWDEDAETTIDAIFAQIAADTQRANEQHAHIMALATRDAAALAMLTPMPAPTVSESFLRAEATYNASLVTDAFPTEIYPTSTPTPPPAIIESVDANSGTQTLLVGADPEMMSQGILLTAPASTWELNGATLNHRQLPGCRLDFSIEARWSGSAGNVYQLIKTIGDREWDVYEIPAEKRRHYYIGDTNTILPMFYTVDRTDPAFAQCRDAVEEIIATFRPAG